ncbi:hypothetical protein V5O48_011223 [Marasmius crinis-equi]|uniref:AB hydrolase-1 domain-containing protein n=1 Tax=Marasmius crinis-equi TaxID=585013 RepID=A0ABR3F669_9AGAR
MGINRVAMFTPHTYKLAGEVEIFFTDSGPPPDSVDYTTVIILHGSAFNGRKPPSSPSVILDTRANTNTNARGRTDGFEKLHEHAHSLNMRLLLWNRRDYPGSTKYTQAELQDLVEGRKIFLDRLGHQLADFILQFVEKEDIPPATSDCTRGGITIMGWSMGTATAMSLFSDPQLLSPGAYAVLEKYVKDLVLDEAYKNFAFWVSSFFDHKSLESGNLVDMDIMKKRSDEPTISKWSKEELIKWLTPEAGPRSEMPMYVEPMQNSLRNMTERVFYDETLVKSYFPKVKVTVLFGTRSCWHAVWAALKTGKMYEEKISEGKRPRTLQIVKIEGGNHYVGALGGPKAFLGENGRGYGDTLSVQQVEFYTYLDVLD